MSESGTGIAVRPDSGGRDVLYKYIGCLCEFPVGFYRTPFLTHAPFIFRHFAIHKMCYDSFIDFILPPRSKAASL